jgi:hypothetical protein
MSTTNFRLPGGNQKKYTLVQKNILTRSADDLLYNCTKYFWPAAGVFTCPPMVRTNIKPEEPMSQPTFTITVDVTEMLTEFIPTLARQFIALRGPDEALKGTNLTLTVDVSGSRYSYTIKHGQECDVKQGDIDNPMVLLSIPTETMSLLADMKNIDMLMGFQGHISGGQVSRQKYNTLASLKGTAVYKLKKPDGKEAVITATFNGAKTPACTLKLSIEDARAVTARKDTPIQMFMGGKLQIEGEMSFALAMQPLFS